MEIDPGFCCVCTVSIKTEVSTSHSRKRRIAARLCRGQSGPLCISEGSG